MILFTITKRMIFNSDAKRVIIYSNNERKLENTCVDLSHRIKQKKVWKKFKTHISKFDSLIYLCDV